MYNTIVVPLDGSALSEKALPYALRLANALQANLALLRVVDNPDFPGDPMQKEHVRVAAKYLAEKKEWLDGDREFLQFTNEITFSPLFGDPADEICHYVKEKAQSLVVMTTHGRSGFSRLLLGSVTGKVVHRLKTPVLLVRPFGNTSTQNFEEVIEAQDEPYANTFLKNGVRLLVPLDRTEKSEAALRPAFELAKELKAALHLFTVNLPSENVFYGEAVTLTFSPEEIQKREAQAREATRVYLGQFAQAASAEGIETVVHVVTGNNPAEEIMRYANQIEPDLIVMASHARGELGRLIYGSVGDQVLRVTHLPVLMVPAGKHGSKTPQVVAAAPAAEEPLKG